MNLFEQMNYFGKQKIPFLFIIDFENINPLIFSLDEIDSNKILFNIKDKTNLKQFQIDKSLEFSKKPISKKNYSFAFSKVMAHIQRGDTYLLNLTFPTEIRTNFTLKEIFTITKAPYKICIADQFVCFSPEPFIKIQNNQIFTFPMKGTIDASLPNAETTLLNDKKELAEHYTIVDLLRNDLSQVATQVKVNKFRYVNEIITNGKPLLQTSSEISGKLFTNNLGDIFQKLLPAGSVTGAPKIKTVDIIQEVEKEKRGYYTGVFGIFDGKVLDSAVIIRFIAQKGKNLFYHSGGGIVSRSNNNKEYNELVDKIYLPL